MDIHPAYTKVSALLNRHGAIGPLHFCIAPQRPAHLEHSNLMLLVLCVLVA